MDVQSNGISKWLLFMGAIAAGLALLGRLVIQPLFAAWIFFTIEKDRSKLRGIVRDAFADDIAELTRSAKEIRECQTEQGEQLAYIAGQLRSREP